jgi:predicted ATP-binding protein involved in virulence
MPTAPSLELPLRELMQPRFRLNSLELTNVKGIDSLTLSFPLPDLPGDPDVFVLGSQNGVGKTTVLEACSLLIMLALDKEGEKHHRQLGPGRKGQTEAPLALLVRAGEREAHIHGDCNLQQEVAKVELVLKEDGTAKVTGADELQKNYKRKSRWDATAGLSQFMLQLAGQSSDPVILPPILYFHSFRKVQEGSQSFASLTERYSRAWRGRFDGDSTVSVFKQELLRAMMGKADLFERLENRDSEEVLKTLNDLMSRYAGGKVEKLLPQPDETFDFRVTPSRGGASFSFDGLSSGQKEVISTMFLIWLYTRKQPSVVLIDEPELHLNPEWHRTFVRDLARLAPRNQYILATHSEEIFASVEPSHRAMLSREDGAA